METDREIAERVSRVRASARDFGMNEIPGYMAWAERKLDEGVSPALIANLDARSMWLLPEEVDSVDEEVFDELLSDLENLLRE